MKSKPFSFRARANSFRFAWEGVHTFFASEHNSWIHLAATILMFLAAGWFHISASELIALVIVTGMVWVAEIFNTVIERIMDLLQPGYHPKVKMIKDLSAAAVLLAAFISVLTAAFIFIPKIL